jgi:NADH-quinone oxidoreductase subunit G
MFWLDHSNFRLDCPICDQGGECDLQEESLRYGNSIALLIRDTVLIEDDFMKSLVNELSKIKT